jgi:RHS repeat-associated protein
VSHFRGSLQYHVPLFPCPPISTYFPANIRNQLAAATYDSAGNAISNIGIAYTYDAEGRIVSAGGTAYTYDGASERVSKPGMLYWKGSGSDALAETSATDTNPVQYIFFNGKRIARLDPGTTTPKYYVADNVGSTAFVTDYLGNPLSESLFYPYGVEQVVLSGDTNTYKFTGKQRDPETGLDNFGARYYASNLGRFMSPDWDAKPITVPYASFGDPQTLNLYTYVENAPLNKVDADGHVASHNVENIWCGGGGTEVDGTDYAYGTLIDSDPVTNEGTPEEQEIEAASSDASVQAAEAETAAATAQQTNAQIRQQIADNANSLVGDTSYNYKDRGKDTCNLFVADQIADSGAPRPQTPTADGHMHDPSASEWGTPDSGSKQNIPGWSSLKPGQSPQPGDVAAVRTNAFEPGSPAHSGIVTAVENGKVTVVASNTHRVGPNPALSGQYPQIVYRRYTGGN